MIAHMRYMSHWRYLDLDTIVYAGAMRREDLYTVTPVGQELGREERRMHVCAHVLAWRGWGTAK